jgi:hypothetical protein
MEHNFDPERKVYLFDDYKTAKDFLKFDWEDYLNTEIVEDEESLCFNMCHYEEEYAVVTWKDGFTTEWFLDVAIEK